jgi:YebC/PmpR family DNA-binding regulatory protein
MPKDNIERAIKRGTGEIKGAELENIVYEAYAPNGVALLIHVLTDNRNRTVAELRRVLTTHNGTMAEAGAVAWQFDRKGYMAIAPDGVDADAIFEAAVEYEAEDIIISDDMIEVFADPQNFEAVRQGLEDLDLEFESAELSMIPQNTLQLAERATMQVMNVIDAIEDLDDVQQVYSNLDITDEILEKFEAAA